MRFILKEVVFLVLCHAITKQGKLLGCVLGKLKLIKYIIYGSRETMSHNKFTHYFTAKELSI